MQSFIAISRRPDITVAECRQLLEWVDRRLCDRDQEVHDLKVELQTVRDQLCLTEREARSQEIWLLTEIDWLNDEVARLQDDVAKHQGEVARLRQEVGEVSK